MKLKLIAVGVLVTMLSGCGSHLPTQGSVSSSLAQINVTGDYHNSFYKLMVRKLRTRGVKVYAKSAVDRDFKPKKGIPTLTVNAPSVSMPIASVDSRETALEYRIVVVARANLKVSENARTIVMRNALTRTALNKSDNTLASANEQELILDECYEELSDQMINRIGYLGKQTDPSVPASVPAQLLLAKDENNNDILIDNQGSMTLIDALKAQDSIEKDNAKSVSLSELNNGMKILNANKTYNLPKTEPKIVHQAPDSVSEEGFIKDPVQANDNQ